MACIDEHRMKMEYQATMEKALAFNLTNCYYFKLNGAFTQTVYLEE